MIPVIHRIQGIRDKLDRIEAADKAGLLDESTDNLLRGLLGSINDRLDNVREFVPSVKADA